MNTPFTFMWIDELNMFREFSPGIVSMLNLSVADDGMLGYGDRLSEKDEVSFLMFWEWQLRNRNAHILLARDDVSLCGMAFMRTNASPNHKHIADLSKGFIHPRVRGGVLLPAMFGEICERAESLAVDLLTLDTRENSRAYKIWTRYGFETYGTLDDYSRFGGQPHVGKYMKQSVAKLKQSLLRSIPGESHGA